MDAGQVERASAWPTNAEQAAEDARREKWALFPVTEVFVAAGQLERAARVARAIFHPEGKAHALIVVTKGLVAAGELERAAAVAADAEQIAHSVTRPEGRIWALTT